MLLADIQIKALQPRDQRYLVSDGRGLARCSAQRIQVMDLRYTLDGKAEKITLAPYPDMTLKAARDRP
jgi:hypothetical protein